jgi:hypothetical protein
MSAQISPPRPLRFCRDGWILEYADVDGHMRWAIGNNLGRWLILTPATRITATELVSTIAVSLPKAPANELVRIVTEHRPELLGRR